MEKRRYETKIGDTSFVFEISSLAEQANAAVLARYGETVVLATAVMSEENKDTDFFPLRVDYEERFYAAGKIIGSRFIRREGRPSEEAVLGGRLIDRVLRPLFDNRMRRDTQVVITVLSYDEEHEPELPGLLAASLALSISNIPWHGPAAGMSVAKLGDRVVLGPSRKEIGSSGGGTLEAFVAGPEGRISMVELSGQEIQESEAEEILQNAQNEINRLVVFQKEIIKEIGRTKADVMFPEIDKLLEDKLRVFLGERIEKTLYPHLLSREERAHELDKTEREHRLRVLKEGLFAYLKEFAQEGEAPDFRSAGAFLERYVDETVHANIIEKNLRPDGRALDEVRPLEAEVGLFERTHGSALFVRGNTQSLAATTIAPPGAEQLIETMEQTGKRRFMLHYNFPSFSTGEIGGFRGPGRREIGHGALAGKAVLPMIPTQEEFPYTIRVVSEILSSNGSSSMATVCATSLSLMDAGVPLKKPVAGIAMGLMTDQGRKTKNAEQKYKVLTDIQGPEDHFGDMDFKVAGTEDGITAIQLDVKTSGLTADIIRDTLRDAKKARLHILNYMKSILAEPRKELSKYAPRVLRHVIDPGKIGIVIGPGGKMINGLIDKYKLASIDIEEDGRIFIAAIDPSAAEAALEEIKLLTKEFKVGDIAEGKVVRILEFGAIVDLGGGQDGMVHVSELKDGFVKKVEDVIKLGDFVRVKVIRAEDGKIGLSIKQLKTEEYERRA